MNTREKTYTFLKLLYSNAHWLVLLLFVASCAQIVAPGGGPKDTRAPKILKYTPDSAQLNFNSKKVELDFDEYVQLKDLNNQLIISPPMEKTPDIKIKNKSLTIDLSDSKLKPNTTYSISFGNALQDLNEGNPIENFKYIFSTGDYIDSLNVKGKVRTAFDHKTDKGILVMLYSDTNDSVVYKTQPDFFAKTTSDGTFQIGNVRPGKYRIFALKDDNTNYKYDVGESLGFVAGTIDASENKSILIDMFQEPNTKFYVKKYVHSEYGKVMVIFSQHSDSVQVKNLAPDFTNDQALPVFSKNADTLIYWLKDYNKDSLKLQISNGHTVIDTLEFKLIKKEDALKSKKNPLHLRLTNNFNGFQTYDLDAPIRLIFSQPIEKINLPAVDLKEDSILIKGWKYDLQYIASANGFRYDSKAAEDPNNPGTFIRSTELVPDVEMYPTPTVFIAKWDSTSMAEDPNNPGTFISAPIKDIRFALKESTKYHLFIPPGTFTDIFGLTNDTIKIDFKTQEQKYYGTIKLKITIPDSLQKPGANGRIPRYIVQLLDDKENFYREDIIRGSETLLYDYVLPRKYILKIIVDENGNGKWDTGNYLKNIQPENVLYDPEQMNVRSNWDLDLEWKVIY
ncbi:MAG: hypothetical protein JWP12_3107 [Bacteroidetes bacterium]|nr:hypothetical protein [Bacteroidota bacterium]